MKNLLSRITSKKPWVDVLNVSYDHQLRYTDGAENDFRREETLYVCVKSNVRVNVGSSTGTGSRAGKWALFQFSPFLLTRFFRNLFFLLSKTLRGFWMSSDPKTSFVDLPSKNFTFQDFFCLKKGI